MSPESWRFINLFDGYCEGTMRNSAAHMAEEKGCLLNLIGVCLDARFEIARRIGVGSYAEIYLARNVAALAGEPEVIVVKALNLQLHGDLEPDLERTLIENIALEAQTLKDFDHPNIVRLFGYGGALDIDGRQFHYLALEHMSGGSFSQFCGSRPLSLEQMLDFTQQVCAALSYAHSRGVLHRDVKPSNIMLASDQRTVKLLDFGTARLLDAGGSITKVGTDLYAAPEHYSLSDVTEEHLTPAADVYALAKTVYYMLCGTSPAPFRQRQITSLATHLKGQSWAGGVLLVLRKATSSKPTERHQSVWDFFEELSSASELTVHSPHQREYEPYDYLRDSSRIVVDVTPESPRNYWLEFKSLCAAGASHLARGARLIGRYVRTAWRWMQPMLQSGWIVTADVCWRAYGWLVTLPRRLLLRVAVVAALSLSLLIVTPYILKLWRSFSISQEQGQENTWAGIRADATTDINIRTGPNNKTQKIGLVERSSRVRVLSYSEDKKWCEIEVIQHGRDKEDPTSADRGWVNRKYLTIIQQ